MREIWERSLERGVGDLRLKDIGRVRRERGVREKKINKRSQNQRERDTIHPPSMFISPLQLSSDPTPMTIQIHLKTSNIISVEKGVFKTWEKSPQNNTNFFDPERLSPNISAGNVLAESITKMKPGFLSALGVWIQKPRRKSQNGLKGLFAFTCVSKTKSSRTSLF